MIKLTANSPTLSEDQLKASLESISPSIPKVFFDFYRQYNGGTPEHAEVTDKKHIFSVHEFYDLSDIQFFKDDLDEYSVPPVLDHTKTLPFACDQGGNTFALYLERENAKVYFYTTSDEMTIHGEWQSFSDFIDSFIK